MLIKRCSPTPLVLLVLFGCSSQEATKFNGRSSTLASASTKQDTQTASTPSEGGTVEQSSNDALAIKNATPIEETVVVPPVEPTKPATVAPPVAPTVAPVLACARSGSFSIDVSVAAHMDAQAKATGRYSLSINDSDVASSSVVKISVPDIVGDVLPISSFGQDDIAIIVKESVSISSVLAQAGAAGNWDRSITIPSDAVMIYDGKNASYAEGVVDYCGKTTYKFANKSPVDIVTTCNGTGEFTKVVNGSTLKAVYGLGVPLVAHNNIKISDLKSKGFVDSKGDIVFKVLHIAHGHGYVNLSFNLSKCQ